VRQYLKLDETRDAVVADMRAGRRDAMRRLAVLDRQIADLKRQIRSPLVQPDLFCGPVDAQGNG
jgi:hypothetical protein